MSTPETSVILVFAPKVSNYNCALKTLSSGGRGGAVFKFKFIYVYLCIFSLFQLPIQLKTTCDYALLHEEQLAFKEIKKTGKIFQGYTDNSRKIETHKENVCKHPNL